jgi:menaquinone-dependent protoporphyrinogen IX oxidase
MNTGSTLVVYHTSSGNTGKVAEAIAEALGADLEQIKLREQFDVNIKGKGLRNFRNMGRVVLDGKLGRDVGIEDAVHDPRDYELVVVGTPVYANTLPAPVRAYLSTYRERFKAVAFFCTGEDPANAHVFDLMAGAAGQDPKAKQPFHAPAVRQDQFAPQVAAFAASLQADEA